MFLSTFRRETGRCSSCVFAMQLTTFAILIFDKWIGHANNACTIRTSAHTEAWASASACSFRVSRLYQSHLPALYQKGKINKKTAMCLLDTLPSLSSTPSRDRTGTNCFIGV